MMNVGRTRAAGLTRAAQPLRTSIRTFWRKPKTPPVPLTAEEAAIDDALRGEMQKMRNRAELMVGSLIGGSLIGLIFNIDELRRSGNWMSYESFYQREKERGAKATEPQLLQDIIVQRVPKDPQTPRAAPNPDSVPLTRQIIKSHLYEMHYPVEDVEAALAEESALGQPPDVTRTLLAVHKRLDARHHLPTVPFWRYAVRHRHVTFVIPAGAAADDALADLDTALDSPLAAYAGHIEGIRTSIKQNPKFPDGSLHVCTLTLENKAEEERLTREDVGRIAQTAALFGGTTAVTTSVAYSLAKGMSSAKTLRAFAGKLNPGLALFPLGLSLMPFTLPLCMAVGAVTVAPFFQTHANQYRGEPVKFSNIVYRDLYYYSKVDPATEGTTWRGHLGRYSPATETKAATVKPVELQELKSSPAPTPPAAPATTTSTTSVTVDGEAKDPKIADPTTNEAAEVKSEANKAFDALVDGVGDVFAVVAGAGALWLVTIVFGGIICAPAMLPFSYLMGRRLSGRMNKAMVEAQAIYRAAHPAPAPAATEATVVTTAESAAKPPAAL